MTFAKKTRRRSSGTMVQKRRLSDQELRLPSTNLRGRPPSSNTANPVDESESSGQKENIEADTSQDPPDAVDIEQPRTKIQLNSDTPYVKFKSNNIAALVVAPPLVIDGTHVPYFLSPASAKTLLGTSSGPGRELLQQLRCVSKPLRSALRN